MLAAGSADAWQVYLDETDLTGPAAPVRSGGVPSVNVTALGTALGMSVRVMGDELLLVDRSGMTWHAKRGATVLEGQGRLLSLDVPLQIMGSSAYLPVNTLAELAELSLSLDAEADRIHLRDPRRSPPKKLAVRLAKTPPASPEPGPLPEVGPLLAGIAADPEAVAPAETDAAAVLPAEPHSTPEETATDTLGNPDTSAIFPDLAPKPKAGLANEKPAQSDAFLETGEGWEPVVVQKSAEELSFVEYDTTASTLEGRGKASDYHPPASRDTLRLGLGLGHVQGADYGLNVSASGGVNGLQVQADSLFTQGREGLKYYSGRVTLRDQSMKWGLEAGDLGTEIWGVRRGLRYTWNRGENRWSKLSAYLPGGYSGKSGLTLAYGDELRLGRNARAAGEVATNGSYMVRSQFQSGNKVSLFGYTRGGPINGYGLLANYRLGRNATLYSSLTHHTDRSRIFKQRTVGLRVPLLRGMDFSLESSLTQADGNRSNLHSAMLGMPLGPLRLYTRYEWGGRRIASDLAPVDLFPQLRSRNWTAILLFPAGERFHLDYQIRKFWDGSGSGQTWNQVMATYRASEKTTLQVITGFPNVSSRDQLHLRLDQQIKEDLSLKVDYGRLSPYQSTTHVRQRQGFSLMLTKRWNINTPVKGGTLKGRVTDPTGKPVPNVVVRCNQYSVTTDKDGRYVLKHLPPGSYQIRLDENSLPANYQARGEEREVRIKAKRTTEQSFEVVSLSTISGTVYEDMNANGAADPGEGVPGAVVEMDGFVTATDKDGRYAFYNVQPGPHRIKLDAELLADREGVGPTEATVDLQPNRPAADLNFKVKKQEKEVFFQLISEESQEKREGANG